MFFCIRCFSQSYDYYYVDEYIRASEDPEYAEYLKQKQLESKKLRVGVDEYKEEKEYQAWLQEQQRKEHIEAKAKIKPKSREKQEREYLSQKNKEEKKYLALQAQYAAWKVQSKERKWMRSNPSRMIASLPVYEKIPKKNRVYKSKKK